MTNETKGWLDAQLELQRASFGVDPGALDERDRATYVRWNALAAGNELHELLDEFQWKPWATRQGFVADRQRVVDEAVDVLHFVGNILLTVGATDTELAERYGVKIAVNGARQAQPGGYTGDGNVAHPEHGSPGVAQVPVPGQQPAPVVVPHPVPNPPVEQPTPAPPVQPQPVAPQQPMEVTEHVGGTWTKPSEVPLEKAVLATSVDDVIRVFSAGGAVAVSVTGDATQDKANRELIYSGAKKCGGKASVRTRKADNVVIGILKPADGAAPAAPAPGPTAAPVQPQAAQAPAQPAPHPLEGKTHVDREGQGWRYVHVQGGWNRAPELDQAQPPAPAAPSF